jgi:hypothetical protein
MEMLHTIPPVVAKTDPFILAMRATDRHVAVASAARRRGDRGAASAAVEASAAPSALEAVLLPMTWAGVLTKVWRAIDLHDAFTLGCSASSRVTG